MPDKLLIFTDLHIESDGRSIIGLDPLARFEEGLTHALAHHEDAQALVLLGDLTHHGKRDQYARLQQALSSNRLPLYATLGNHDSAKNFVQAFPDQVDADGFAQHAFDLGPLRVLILDTHDHQGAVQQHAGWLCERRLRWLDIQLALAGQRPLLVACHHPPFATGFDGMDAINLINGDALLMRLRDYPGPLHLLCGHIHRTISGHAGGVAFTTLKSPCHQMPMILGPGSSALSVDEPGAYGIALATNAGLVIHTEDFAIAGATQEDPLSG